MKADNGLRIVFMGTPAYAEPVLASLLDADYEVAGVYTRPDTRAGRGKQLAPSSVKAFALDRGLAVFQPSSLRRDENTYGELASISPDLIVVAAYGLFLPTKILNLPRLGCLNVHPSLLPRYRGASPVASAVVNGDDIIGVTILQIDEGMDSGPIVAQRDTPIEENETAGELTTRLFEMGADLLLEVLPRWQRGEIQPQPQDDSQATITRRLSKNDGRIDWDQPAGFIVRQVRAYDPWPGSFTFSHGKLLKIVDADSTAPTTPPSASPGQVVALGKGIGVVAGDGTVVLKVVQLEGRRAVTIREFAQGHRDFIGTILGAS